MKILIWVKDFILHFFKRIFQILLPIIIALGCAVIYVLTYEPGTRRRATARKARRIRFLTKIKLHIYEWLSPFWKFPKCSYLSRLYNRFHFLIDK